jgi:hypothetical protein
MRGRINDAVGFRFISHSALGLGFYPRVLGIPCQAASLERISGSWLHEHVGCGLMIAMQKRMDCLVRYLFLSGDDMLMLSLVVLSPAKHVFYSW